MSSAALIVPYDPQATGQSVAGVNPAQLWSLTPSGDKAPKAGTTRTFYNTPESKTTTISSIGEGFANKSAEVKRELVRKSVGSAVKELKAYEGVKEAVVDASLDPHAAAVAAHLALYKFTLKTSPTSPFDPRLTEPIPEKIAFSPIEASKEWDRGVVYAQAQNLARTLMEYPANLMTPTIFTERVKKEFEGVANVEIIVHDEAWAEEKGMNTFLSVTHGTSEPAKFLEIHYKGAPNKDDQPLAFVGKGITFDSGGISLKPGAGMKLMRADMGGAATVVSAALAIAKLQIPINLVVSTPLTENMPGPSATKPGDIVYAMNGKSVEVDNTDAEGRLVLSDAIWYTSTEYKPHTLIDVATLTGAMVIALGEVFSGVFSSSDELWQKLYEAGQIEHDRFWRMPLDDEFGPQIHSSNADLQNTGGRPAGSITAALFLKPHVNGLEGKDGEESSIKWAHIDIAGTMEATRPGPYQEKGLTGRPVRITSFKPLIACLPSDLWRFEKGILSKLRVLHPARTINQKDLKRYLTYYADRIRQFHAEDHFHEILSAEAFKALKLAANGQDGVLAPRITSLHWLEPSQLNGHPRTLRNRIYPFFSLFMGPKISGLGFVVEPEYSTQVDCVRSSLERYPDLKELDITLCHSEHGFSELLALEYLEIHPWNHLETLKISYVWDRTIPIVASLPRLVNLHLVDLKEVPLPNASHSKQVNRGFATLESLEITGNDLPNIVNFIQYLPVAANSRIRAFAVTAYDESTVTNRQQLIKLVKVHLNPSVLQRLKLAQQHILIQERMEVDPDIRLDISPLYEYRNLVDLEVNLVEDVWPTPEEVTQQFPAFWPNISSLKLSVDPDILDHRLPRINYTHIMELLRACRNIRTLGLRFDATGIRRGEKITEVDGSRLSALFVGDSPIYSPERVSEFLGEHFPQLEGLHTFTSEESIERMYTDEMPLPMYTHRWVEVAHRLDLLTLPS
ncbi:hypothetical protein EST38_g6122 [Candolleomyces aberdarensis]|uniref:Cytosol aminopeptidase domain-containing protein n=1 Tax=Candolleomyces aberdarensis TaxID=2316362 RepID=A0A4V1Q3T7_9AGAR|nr:hypothetical protein EST38_g6122 [Candolleomyces aberdarensis]